MIAVLWQARAVFASMDLDGDGAVTKVEMESHSANIGVDPASQRIQGDLTQSQRSHTQSQRSHTRSRRSHMQSLQHTPSLSRSFWERWTFASPRFSPSCTPVCLALAARQCMHARSCMKAHQCMQTRNCVFKNVVKVTNVFTGANVFTGTNVFTGINLFTVIDACTGTNACIGAAEHRNELTFKDSPSIPHARTHARASIRE
eukprot:6201997-Pleurochrysis_carterae.AAC.3